MLDHIKVIELASVLAGPSVGQFFAELGAEVIKIESPKNGGDVTRTWKLAGEQTDDRSAYFCAVNWGKKSLALNLSKPEAKEVLKRLIVSSDIVIASYKPGDAEKLGVDYPILVSQNSRLIYGQVTGYGSEEDRVGYDAVIQAESGFMSLNGEAGGPPLKMPVAIMDILAAHHLKEALLLALLKRERTGEGSFVEVSLIQAAISSLANQATNWLVGGKLPERQGSAHPNIAPYGDVFDTADKKKLLLAIGNDRQFCDLCHVLELHELAGDEEFKSNHNRVQNRSKLLRLLQQRISQLKADDLLSHIHNKKIPAGVIQNVKEVFETRYAAELLLLQNGLKGIRNFVAKGSNFDVKPLLATPPHLGEHTEEILNSINFSEKDISGMRSMEVIR